MKKTVLSIALSIMTVSTIAEARVSFSSRSMSVSRPAQTYKAPSSSTSKSNSYSSSSYKSGNTSLMSASMLPFTAIMLYSFSSSQQSLLENDGYTVSGGSVYDEDYNEYDVYEDNGELIVVEK